MEDCTDTGSLHKKCTGCGVDKAFEDFSFDNRHADGRQSRCKLCVNAQRRNRRAADPEQARERKRLDYQRNREKYLAQATARRDAARVGPRRIFGDDELRFWSYVHKTAGCWLWTGALDETGYGVFNAGAATGGRARLAHVWAYERFVGPVPTGLELDHVKAKGCTNRNCVNYEDHLEPVTHRENMRRSSSTKLSDQDVQRAWQLVQSGTSIRAVGRSLGVSHQTLRYRFKQLLAETAA